MPYNWEVSSSCFRPMTYRLPFSPYSGSPVPEHENSACNPHAFIGLLIRCLLCLISRHPIPGFIIYTGRTRADQASRSPPPHATNHPSNRYGYCSAVRRSIPTCTAPITPESSPSEERAISGRSKGMIVPSHVRNLSRINSRT